jgi:hypothetical protein
MISFLFGIFSLVVLAAKSLGYIVTSKLML